MREYFSTEDFLEELIEWGKAWIDLYCRYSVDMDEEGALARIRGKLIFKRELEHLCQNPYSEQKVEEYRQERQKLLDQIDEMHQGCQTYIRTGGMVTLEYLHHMFSLGQFEWYVFCMAYLLELEPQLERVYCLLQDDFDRKAPTLELLLRMYTLEQTERLSLQQQFMSRWEYLRQLFTGGLGIERFPLQRISGPLSRNESLLSYQLTVDQRIVRFLQDMDSLDEQLQGAVEFYLPTHDLAPMGIRQKQVTALNRLYRTAEKEQGFLYLSGEKDIGKKFLVRHFARKQKRPLILIHLQWLPKLASMESLVARLTREALLKGNAMICLADVWLENPQENKDQEEPGSLEFGEMEKLLDCFEQTPVTPIFTSVEPWPGARQTKNHNCVEFKLEPLSLTERRRLWEGFLKEYHLKADASRLAGTYELPPGAIARAAQEVTLSRQVQEASEGKDKDEKPLYLACRRQLTHSLGRDAVWIPAQYTMEDLVLPGPQKRLLLDACDMIHYRHKVFEDWGFSQKLAYGRGVSMIFYGPPGTGKTMGAQAIANELNLELYRVDMAAVLSKYVGESEKKLGNIFDQGQKSQSILFFDEADALFGKRSEVKDSQDKYANASTAFLLQKLEEYQGIIILATNLLQNFDAAFCRRFQYMIEFPFPDEARRREIWERVFPEQLPAQELDLDYLAQEFVLSGSQIKNIAVAAAFLAAGQNRSLEMVDILQAVKREMKKTGKNMIASDFGIYYSLMECREGE